jgi:glycosyltransferase involved in cell wall biosynthesis
MTRRYSVAVVAACPFPYPRGTPIRILRMAESLVARGHHVEVVTYHLGQAMEDLTFPIHRIPRVPTYNRLVPGPTYQKLLLVDPLLTAKLFSLLRSKHFDVIHAHHYEGLLASLPASRWFNVPVVFDVHTLLSSELPYYPLGLPRSWLYRIGECLDRLIPPRADHIVAVTHAIRDKLMRQIGIAGDKVTTVYTAHEGGASGPAPGDEVREAPNTLIYTGTLESYQGIDLMLKALRKVLDQRPDVRLKIVSDSTLEPHRHLIQDLHLADNLDLVQADYFRLGRDLHSAMIALSPRVICDGLPVKVLNYMATGRAIVAFAGSAEILKNEQTGLVIKDNDIDAFAAAVLRLLGNTGLARELGRNAQSHVEEFFVWESAAKLLETIYSGLLREPTSKADDA